MNGYRLNKKTVYFEKNSAVLLETERLTIRQFALSDASFIIELLNSPGWLRFINNRNIHTIDDAANYLQTGPFASYLTHGFGHYCVVLKDSGFPIGMCGIIKRDALDDPDIGFAFLPQYNGKGYAYEAATAVLQYAMDTLGITKISAITTIDNASSIRLIDKLGMFFEKEFALPAEGKEMLLFTKQ